MVVLVLSPVESMMGDLVHEEDVSVTVSVTVSGVAPVFGFTVSAAFVASAPDVVEVEVPGHVPRI